jgi:Dihaem cytochrome c
MSARSIVHMALSCVVIGSAMYAATSMAGGSHVYTATDAVWKEECGACHVAYPPQLLSAASWRALMDGLDRHFETDASLDVRTARHITAFLERSASVNEARTDQVASRITETRWFRKEHDEVPAATWNRPDMRSRANCGACHTRAEDGDYSGRTRRVPR